MLHAMMSRPARALGVIAALLTVVVAGFLVPARAAAQGGDLEPVITDVTVTPSTLPYTGGTVTFSAYVSDPSGTGLTGVFGELRSPLGSPDFVVMTNSGMTPDHYTGTIDVPANFSDDPAQYAASVSAQSQSGLSTLVEAGDVTVDAQPQFDEPPEIYDPAVSPRSLPHTGGPVALSVTAWDLRGIFDAHAVVTGPDGAQVTVPLEPLASATRFEGMFTAPPNTTATPRQYTVTMYASDDIGQQSSVDAGAFTVAGRPAAAPGRLVVTPGTRSFGSVAVGAWATRTVTVKHVGKRSAIPITGTTAVTGAGFAAPATAFSLLHGQSRSFAVEFRPPAAGSYLGAFRVQADGKAPLAVRLTGRGVAPKRR